MLVTFLPSASIMAFFTGAVLLVRFSISYLFEKFEAIDYNVAPPINSTGEKEELRKAEGLRKIGLKIILFSAILFSGLVGIIASLYFTWN